MFNRRADSASDAKEKMSMEFFVQFGLLFANMTWPVILCLILGIVLILVEIFQPGFGIFGTSGGILVVLAVILRAIYHTEGDDVLAQIFIMIFVVALFIIVGFCLMILTSKMGWLKRTPLIEESTAVGEVSDGTANYQGMEGKLGYAMTDMRPVGKIAVDGMTYDAQAESFFIENGKGVKIVQVEGAKIIVRKLD